MQMSEQSDFRNLGLPVTHADVGKRLDYHLSENFPFFSRSAWQRRIDANLMTVNSSPTKCSYRLKLGDRLAHFHPLDDEPAVDTNVQILWQKHGVLCAYKPAGLAMHEHGMFRRKTFRELIKIVAGQEWAAVHRLDLETSGLVICGANDKIRSAISEQLENRTVAKTYLAIAHGRPLVEAWTVNAPIGLLNDRYARVKAVDDNGTPAQTEFAVVEERQDYVLLTAAPLTGRTNQIRVHAAHCGHPLVGDLVYGARHANPAPRTFLHSHSASFTHPETGTREAVSAPMADDMRDFWRELGYIASHKPRE